VAVVALTTFEYGKSSLHPPGTCGLVPRWCILFCMRSNTVIALALFTLLTGLPAAAHAQQPEVGISYSYARITTGDGLSLPAGFLVSVAGGGDSPWLVGEVGGNFKSDHGQTVKLFTIQGGVRFFTQTREGWRPFGQFLIGLGTLRVGNHSSNKFSFEPAGGVDFPLSDGISFRAGVGLPILVTEGENLKTFRFNLGIVLGGR
jgi:hypothetical protein